MKTAARESILPTVGYPDLLLSTPTAGRGMQPRVTLLASFATMLCLAVSLQDTCFGEDKGVPGESSSDRKDASVEPEETPQADLDSEPAPAWSAAAKKTTENPIPPIVVRFSAAEPEEVAALEEDLSVMGRIMDRSLVQSFGKQSAEGKKGIRLLPSSSGRSVRAMYTEGFGALFTLKVNFPLMPPTPANERRTDHDVNSDWEQARQEVYGRFEDDSDSEGNLPKVEFDPARVQALKRAVMLSLRNASNIRGLQPGEFLTVTAFGTPTPVQLHTERWVNGPGGETALTTKESFAAGIRPQYAGVSKYSPDSNRGTVLTLRVKKSDVDAYAKAGGQLADFEKKVVSNSYRGYGHGITSLNSWVKQGPAQAR
jgi:hypothetical protein